MTLADDRVTGVEGSPDLTTTDTGPEQIVDAAGNKAWRLVDGATLDMPTRISITPRAMTLFIFGRQHKRSNNCYFFFAKHESDGETSANTLGAPLASYGSG